MVFLENLYCFYEIWCWGQLDDKHALVTVSHTMVSELDILRTHIFLPNGVLSSISLRWQTCTNKPYCGLGAWMFLQNIYMAPFGLLNLCWNWLKNIVLAEMLWEKNTVPGEKRRRTSRIWGKPNRTGVFSTLTKNSPPHEISCFW